MSVNFTAIPYPALIPGAWISSLGSSLPVPLILGIILFVIGGIALSLWLDKKRREAMQAIALQLGFSFSPDKDHGLASAYGFLDHTYNALVAIRNHIKDACANIDTELKRRYDLIPNLVETTKGYAKHERETLERVIELRNQCKANQGSPAEQALTERQLVAGLSGIFALAENYPDLKANANFLQLQTELVNTEDRIQAARRFYNGNVRNYRNKTQTFPSNIVADLFVFPPEAAEFFEVDPVQREATPARF